MTHSTSHDANYDTAIALIGVSGRFPGARNVDAFWRNVTEGAKSIRFFSDEELLAAGADPEEIARPDYVKAGAIVDDADMFDASFFKFSPREAEVTDPQHRFFLECAWEALEDAGYDPETYQDLIGVFAGSAFATYLLNNLAPNSEIMKLVGYIQASIGNDKDSLASMVSYKLNLRGPSIAVQTFCSTSLVAIHLASQSLLNFECDIALAGGVAIFNPQVAGYVFEEGGILSPDGECRTFDANGRGSVMGNGVGIVALKRLADAIEDGDQIYATLLGSAVNNDGSVRVSYTAPGLGGQTEVIAQALSNANVSAETIGYFEAHGTATVLGDSVELAAMKKAFRRDTDKKQFCAIGSLKPNVGHLDRASGVSGLIKAALALKHRLLPPSLNFERASDDIDLDNSPFYVNTQLQEWQADDLPRRAGVSSFGVGGTNAHVVLEEAPELEPSTPARPWQLLQVSARTEHSLNAATANLATFLKARSELNLADAAYTLQVGRGAFNQRRFVVGRDHADAIARLQAGEALQATTAQQAYRDRPVAFLLPDLDQAHVAMADELYQQETVFREAVDTCLAILRERADLDLRGILNPGITLVGQTTQALTLFVVEYALARLFEHYGIQPQALLGQGTGEYVAACLSGIFSLEDALLLLVARARLLQATSQEEPGATLAEDLTRVAQTLTLHPPQVALVSSVSGTWMTPEEATDPTYWGRQLSQPLHSAEGIAHLLQDTECVLLEVGPIQALSAQVKAHPACDATREAQLVETLATSLEFQSDRASVLNAIGRLWLAGVTINWRGLYEGERRLRVSLPTYAFERQRYWLDSPAVLQYKARASAQALISREADKADWFYRAHWEQEPLAKLAPLTPRNWLVFMDGTGLAEEVTHSLDAQQHRLVRVYAGSVFAQQDEQTFVIRPHEDADYVRLCDALVAAGRLPDRVLHCWSVSAERELSPASVELFHAEQEHGFYSLLFLAQALAPHIYDGSVQLIAVSTHVQAVTGRELLRPEKATVLGACKVIPQEPLNITCRSIDLDVSSEDWQQAAIEQVIAECTLPANDLIVAYRDQQRWVQRYAAVQLPPKSDDQPLFREQGVYLITGGLGGIGLALAEHLARTVHARVVLVGRSGLPAREAWQAWLDEHDAQDSTSEKIRRMQTIEALGGQALIFQADVADGAQMRNVIQETLATYGALHGVFHAAGITHESAFKAVQDLDRERSEVHFQGKVYGAYALQEALGDIELDFCLLFSSLSATLGGLAFTAYTAANIFLDAFAHRYNQSAKRPWVSVNWDTWQVREDVHGAFGATVAAFAMSPAEGIEALTRVLASGHTHIINSTGDLEARIRQWIRLESLQEIEETRSSGEQSAQPIIAEDYEPKIAEIWRQVLGVEQVGVHDNFFDLGGNSLVALEVISRMKKAFRMQIPAVALFEASTISALAKYLRPASVDVQVAAQHNALNERRQRAKQHTNQDGIAIIGMALRFPGATTVEKFWEHLRDGEESITHFSDEELLAAGVDLQTLRDPDYVKARPVLDGIDQFDANFFGYSPREAELTDPQHRLFLECAWEAMEKAGYDTRNYDGLVGVFGGTNLSTYLLSLIAGSPEVLQSIDGFQIGIGNDKDSLTTSVSYKLNLRGPSFAVQTFCSTSLVATHLACQSLLHGECDMAMAGGVSIRVPHRVGYWFQEGGQESPDGHCRTFDAKSQGSVLGDGVGIVVLKRLSDALEDGDTIHAVIQGSAINNDGSLKVSYSAPSVAGQSEVVVQALANAGVSAEDVAYVEAHGTATELGDPIEVASLTKAYRLQTDRTGYCAIGSLKTNMGHLDRAAGVAGLIKTVLALKHEAIPASLHYESPNPEIDFEQSPFFVNTELRPWPRGEKPRYAGVNSLGMGGTNVHIVLREAPEPQPTSASRPWQLLTLSARTETALEQATTNLHDYLQTHDEVPLADVAYTLQVGRATFEQRRVLVCRDRQEAIAALDASARGKLLTQTQDQRERAVAFLLPGVGEQSAGMTRELYETEPVFKASVDRCCAYIKRNFDLDLYEVLYPAKASDAGKRDIHALLGSNGQKPEAIRETSLAQPAVFVIEYALAQQFMQWGIRPRALLGYSMGEYVAACLAGVFSLEDALTLVMRRAQLIQDMPSGAMLVVALSEAAVQPYLDEQVNLAIINAPDTCVLAGPADAIERVEARLTQRGIVHRRAETTHAFHSAMLQPLQSVLTELVHGVKLNPPAIPYLSNVSGTWITAEEATDPTYWARHMCETVRFADGVGHLLEETAYALLEVGPGQALGSFVRQHPACGRERFSQIAATSPARYERLTEPQALLTALSKLWLAGVTPDWSGLYSGERRQRVVLPTYPFERQRYWLEPPKASRRSRSSEVQGSRQPVLTRKEDPADWFYQETWRSTPLSGAPAPALRYRWLVLLDETGLGAKLAEGLLREGYTVTRVEPGASFARLDADHFQVRAEDPDDYARLLETLAAEAKLPRRVLHTWAVSAGLQIPGTATLQQAAAGNFYSLVYLARALSGYALSEPLGLYVLSTNAQQVHEHDIVQPEHALAQGASMVIAQEPLNVACRNIDLTWEAGAADGWQDETLLATLLRECTGTASELTVAYRQRERWERTYEACRLPESSPELGALREQGVYLITGGLGGIGLALAEDLATRCRARLVLLSRRELPQREGWETWLAEHEEEAEVSQVLRRLQGIEARGSEVLLVQAEVSDPEQMQAAMQATQTRFGGLHGVFHAAGVVDERYFKSVQDIGREDCEVHLRAKGYGTLALAEALAGQTLDFVLLFSSLSAALGGLGFVAYTATNRYLEAYTRWMNQQGRGRWVSVGWDTWLVRANAHGSLGGTIAMFAMEPHEGLEALRRVLESDAACLVQSTGDLNARLRQWVNSDLLNEHHASLLQGATSATQAGKGGQTLSRGEVESRVRAIWQEVLGLEKIGNDEAFFEVGGNSLIALEVIGKLKKSLGRPVPAVALFEAPTIALLVDYLLPPTAAQAEAEESQQERLRTRRRKARQQGEREGIAIISMSGRFPGASSVEQFWENLREGRESISFFTPEELESVGIGSATYEAPNFVAARPVLPVEVVEGFDAGLFDYSPREAELTDPQHRLFLECAWEALERAGYNSQEYEGQIGVFGGTNISTYMFAAEPAQLAGVNDYQLLAGNDKDSLTSSVSYKLNLRGPAVAVQTFCSTSLVATHLGCQSLRTGECDLALAGGVSVRVPSIGGHLYEPGGMESPDGHCRTFDAQAGGSMFGDGVGVIVLKRLEDALEDGDEVLAVIRGSAINNDGAHKVSYAAPSVIGQAEVVLSALEDAGVSAESISYVEAHGTATELGDPIEVASLTKAYRQQTEQVGYCAIGSVKTNVGHLDRAAGISGLIKTVLALKHEELPASLHYNSPNPEIDFEHSPFYVNAQRAAWRRGGERPRRAGINSLGMGGTNAHVVIEEAPEREPSGASRPWQVLPLSARTPEALEQMRRNLGAYLREHTEVPLADAAYTLQVGRRRLEQRAMLLCRDRQEALKWLEGEESVVGRVEEQTERPVGFLLPGVGEQYVGMARQLYEREAVFHEEVDRCCALLEPLLGLDLRSLLFEETVAAGSSNGNGNGNGNGHYHNGKNGATAGKVVVAGHNGASSNGHGPEKQLGQLRQTELAQPALFVIDYALARLLMNWGVRPQALLGYSVGEYVAACLAGVFSLEDALHVVAQRARWISDLPAGAMLAVALGEDEAMAWLATSDIEGVSLAASVSPTSSVLGGTPEAIAQLRERLEAAGIACREVQSSHAFHTPLLAPIQQQLRDLLASLPRQKPAISYLSNVSGTWITAEQATDPEYWATQMCSPVRFARGVESLLAEGEYALVEVGPGQALGSFVRQHPNCTREQRGLVMGSLPALYEAQEEQEYLLGMLGKLWLSGVRIDWTAYAAREHRQRVVLPTYPFERQRYWLESRKGDARPLSLASASSSPRDTVSTLKKEELTDWFYLPTWKMSAPIVGDLQEMQTQDTTWLLFMDECGVGARLLETLREWSDSIITVRPGDQFVKVTETDYRLNPGERADYDALLKELRAHAGLPRKIVHLWTVTAGEQTPDSLLERGFYSLFSLAQALGDAGVEECQITVISNELQDVSDADQVNPLKATVIGPCRVIPQEYEGISCRSIDIALPRPDSKQAANLAAQLLGELLVESNENIVALRGKRRWVPSFEPVALATSHPQTAHLRQGGVYLLTGGLGGIALAIADLLARTLQAKLVLLNRTGLPEREQWPSLLEQQPESKLAERLRKIQALEAQGSEVLVLQADVASEEQMRAACEQIQERFGDLHGVFHLAGVPGVGLTQLKSREQAASVLAPKVQGALVLERVLRDRPLDFMVLFSSVTSTTGGGPGQIDYSAANAFLDAFAHRAQQTEQGCVIAIDWGEWQWNAWEDGLAGYEDAVQAFLRDHRHKFGIPLEEGAEALQRILSSDLSHLVVSTQDFRVLAEQSKSFTAAYLREQEQQMQQGRKAHPRPNLAGSYVQARNDLEQQIVALWEDLLGISPIGINDNFFELGGNSLTGIDLISRLRKTLKLETLASHVLYEAPTIGLMAQYLDKGKAQSVVKGRVERGEKRRDSLKQRVRETRKTR